MVYKTKDIAYVLAKFHVFRIFADFRGSNWVKLGIQLSPFPPLFTFLAREWEKNYHFYAVWITSEKWINSVSQIAKYLSIDKVGNTGWKWGFICLAGLSYIFSQQLFKCSKSTVKTLEKGRNMLKGNNKETRTTSMTSFCHWLSWYKTSFLYKSLHKNFFVQWIICWDFIRYEYHITAYTWFVKLCLPKFP